MGNRRAIVQSLWRVGLLAIAIVVMLVVVLAGCGSKSSSGGASGSPSAGSAGSTSGLKTGGGPTGTPQSGGEIRMSVFGGGSSDHLDPALDWWQIDSVRNSLLYDTLTVVDQSTGEPVMHLAKSMTPNASGTVWTITLPSGLKFSNGQPVTSADVLWTLKRVAKDHIYDGVTNLLNLAASHTTDAVTLQLVCKQPIGDMAALLSDQTFDIVPANSTNLATKGAPGTGPFRLVSFTPGIKVSLEKNPYYRVAGKPYLDKFTLIEVSDPVAALDALQAGQVDFAGRVSSPAVQALQGSSQFYIRASQKGWASPYMYMNMSMKPFNDPAVRKAMRLAFDREKAIQVAYLGFGHPGNDLFGEAHASYNSSLPQRTYDPAAAKNLLQAAGYTLPLKVTLYCADGGAGMIEGAEVLQQSAKAAGFDVTLKKVTPGELYNPATVLGKVPLGMDFYGGNSFQQMVFQTMLSNAPTPEFGMNSKAFDKAFYSALAILDPAKRKAAYDAIQKQLWEDGGAIVWAYADNITAFSSKVGGTEAFDGPTIGLFYPGLNSGDLWIQH